MKKTNECAKRSDPEIVEATNQEITLDALAKMQKDADDLKDLIRKSKELLIRYRELVRFTK